MIGIWWLIDWLIDWCLTSSEQFFSYIQDDDFETVSDSVVFLFFIFFFHVQLLLSMLV
jgi:hypothetical protein